MTESWSDLAAMPQRDQALLLWVPEILRSQGLEAPLRVFIYSSQRDVRVASRADLHNSTKSSGHSPRGCATPRPTHVALKARGPHSMSSKGICSSSYVALSNSLSGLNVPVSSEIRLHNREPLTQLHSWNLPGRLFLSVSNSSILVWGGRYGPNNTQCLSISHLKNVLNGHCPDRGWVASPPEGVLGKLPEEDAVSGSFLLFLMDFSQAWVSKTWCWGLAVSGSSCTFPPASDFLKQGFSKTFQSLPHFSFIFVPLTYLHLKPNPDWVMA